MKFEFMGAFLDREDDDQFSILQRTLRLTCHSVVAGTAMLMAQSAWFSGYRGGSINGALVTAVLFAIAVSVVFASYKVDEFLSAPQRKTYLGPAILLLGLAAGEAGRFLGWWDMLEVLRWWRAALLLVAMTFAVSCTGEKVVQLQRSRREGT